MHRVPGMNRSGLVEIAHRLVWRIHVEDAPFWKIWLVDTAKLIVAVARDLAEGQLTLRAMSLVYTTLLSLVPLLAISFSILKGFGVHNQIEPFLLNFLAPMGEEGVRITNQIIGFVENVKVGVLGFLGFALLFYTVVSLLQKVERAFNYAWHITLERTFAQRVRDYLSVLIVGPVLVFTSVGIMGSLMSAPLTASLTAIEPIGSVVSVLGTVIPFVMIVAAFTFIYMFIPNTTVQFRAALYGGVVAGFLWNTVGWLFASFVIGSAKYTAIYSTFATLVFFMLWLYVGWLILLLGACISFYRQRPEFLAVGRDEAGPNNRLLEKSALLVIFHIGKSFYAGQQEWTAENLAAKLNTAHDTIARVLAALCENGILAMTSGEIPTYVPACPLEETSLKRVLDAVRSAEETDVYNFGRLKSVKEVDEIDAVLEAAMAAALQDVTIKGFVSSRLSETKKMAAE